MLYSVLHVTEGVVKNLHQKHIPFVYIPTLTVYNNLSSFLIMYSASIYQ